MQLKELLQDIYELDERLRVLEQNYGILLEDMYMLYRLGELEQSKDLIRWVGYYEFKQERQRAYTTALREHWLNLRRTNLETPILLQPLAAT